jgi:branched-chain amino acid transport system permease protein
MLLVFMMLKRPEGLVPSARCSRELHQEEFLQDAWLKGDKSDADADDEDAVNVGDGGGEEE